MLEKLKFKIRRIGLLVSFFVLIITLSGCSSAGKPTGKLDKDAIYASAGDYKVTKGDIWDELRWNASSILTDKITEVVMKDYVEKVTIVMEKSFAELTDDQKKLFDENLTNEAFTELKASYEDRLEDYVIEDIYNFNFDAINSYDKIENLNPYEAAKLVAKYCDEIFTNYNISKIEIEDENHNKKSVLLKDCVTEAASNEEQHTKYYVTIAKELNTIYYQSLAKELLAYSVLEDDIKEAYDNRDTSDEDDLGYFSKTDYTTKFKSDFANQSDLNLVLIHFSTEKEFTSTLRSFGLKVYENRLVYIPRGDRTFTEYCTYYDELTTSDLRDNHQVLHDLDIAQIYIQMYNYLYGGYRNYLYDDSYIDKFEKVEDLITITDSIREKSQLLTEGEQKEALNNIRDVLVQQSEQYDVDTIFTRKEIDKISTSLSTYLYETLSLPYPEDTTSDDVCYSTSTQTYNSSYWIAFKFGLVNEEKYADIYNKNIVDDDLYENIAKDEALKLEIEKLLKIDKITSTQIDNAVKERTEKVEISIYDEALEISYATSNSDYSKTYGKAPNSNVLATLKYNKKTWNLNIVEDLEDENALSNGVYNILERQSGINTAINLLSKQVVKNTKAYEETAKKIDEYKESLEYVLAAFSNNYYSTSGYPSTIGKYNFMMLYFHSADINQIVAENYRVNEAASKLLTNYNSNKLLEFFKSYSDNIYNNYFTISGKRLVVYLDADDDSEKDDVETWTATQKDLAKDLIRKIYNEVASTTGSHNSALTSIVSEINGSARAKFENNPIAPENKWAEYRKAGLNVEMEEISADNSTTSLDFALKERLLKIHDPESEPAYSINETTPTEYLEDLQNPNTQILETKDGFNLLLITSAEFKPSAEFKKEDDKLGMFEDISVYYNEEYHQIGTVYNEGKALTLEQIRLYVLEYVSSSTSNLTPSVLSSAISSFLAPVITRYTANETQRDVILYLIETKAGKLDFNENNDRYQEILNINHRSADDYISIYFEEDSNLEKDPTNTLTTYENWWTDLQAIVAEILLTEGEDA